MVEGQSSLDWVFSMFDSVHRDERAELGLSLKASLTTDGSNLGFLVYSQGSASQTVFFD